MFSGSPRQVPVSSEVNDDGGDSSTVPVSIHAFCHQISGAEFEQQKLASSQKAMEELLEMLLSDQNLTEKERRKKLKQVTKRVMIRFTWRQNVDPDFPFSGFSFRSCTQTSTAAAFLPQSRSTSQRLNRRCSASRRPKCSA